MKQRVSTAEWLRFVRTFKLPWNHRSHAGCDLNYMRYNYISEMLSFYLDNHNVILLIDINVTNFICYN